MLVSARLTPSGAAQAVLDQAEAKYDLLLSDFILQQVERVLHHPHIQAGFPHLNDAAIAAYIASLRKAGNLVDETTPIDASPDPEDNRILAAAVDGQADYLVTGNLSHFPPACGQIKILSLAAFRYILKQSP